MEFSHTLFTHLGTSFRFLMSINKSWKDVTQGLKPSRVRVRFRTAEAVLFVSRNISRQVYRVLRFFSHPRPSEVPAFGLYSQPIQPP